MTEIANARTHGAEQRARADLEALVETSPVGIAVLDGGTGIPVSLNREAWRIVESLRISGRLAEDLLGVLTCRFADGREIALDEFPLARALSGAETVRAEEIVLSVPDGRSVTTLVNATPIHGPDGAVASVVVAGLLHRRRRPFAPPSRLHQNRALSLNPIACSWSSSTSAISRGRSGSPTSRPMCRRSASPPIGSPVRSNSA